MGILFEAELNNTTYCFKKLLLRSCFSIYWELANQAEYRIGYMKVDNLFRCEKVRHDPLSYTEASKCLLDLLHKVHKAIDNLFTQDRLRHGDLRLPNICFNGRFDVVLIDLDFADIMKSICSDLKCFAEDLTINIESLEEKPSMEEMMIKGNYNEQQIQKDFGSTKSIKEVILECTQAS